MNKSFSRFLFCAFVAVVTLTGMSCSTVVCEDEDCEAPQARSGSGSGLTLTSIDEQTFLPAKVSILFKVEDDNGTPISGLNENDFIIRDDERPDSEFESRKRIVPIPDDRFMNSIALVLDFSGSIIESGNLGALKTAVKAFVTGVSSAEAVEVGIWWFDGTSSIEQLAPFSSDFESLNRIIDDITSDIPSDNSTNLYGAVVQGIDVVEARLVENRQTDDITAVGSVIFLTDGTDQAARESRQRAIDDARETRLNVYTVGVEGESDNQGPIDEDFLNAIIENEDDYFLAENISDLAFRFLELTTSIRDDANSYYLLEYCSPRRSGGSHNLDITANLDSRSGILETTYSSEGFTAGCVIN